MLTASKRQVRTTYKYSNSERQLGLTDWYEIVIDDNACHCDCLILDFKPRGSVGVKAPGQVGAGVMKTRSRASRPAY